MLLEENKIYVTYKDDVLRKILIVNGDNTCYYKVPKCHNLKKTVEEVNKILEYNLDVVLVDEKDNEKIEVINKKIYELDSNKYYRKEIINTVFGILFNVVGIYSSSFSKIIYLISSVFSTSFEINAIKYNSRQPKKESEVNLFKKLRFYLTYAVLSMNFGFAINNLSIKPENFVDEAYKLEADVKSLAYTQYRNFSIKDYKNPFDNETVENKFEILMTAFNDNKFISELDSKVANKLEYYINNNPYFDYERTYDRFRNLIVVDSKYKYKNIGASYHEGMNLITNYDMDNKTEDDYMQHLYHEYIHATGNFNNKILNEGMTSAICRKYYHNMEFSFSMYNDGYGQYIHVINRLIKIVGYDKMLEAYTKEDDEILKNALLDINSDKKTYTKLMNLLEKEAKKEEPIIDLEKIDEILDEYPIKNAIYTKIKK